MAEVIYLAILQIVGPPNMFKISLKYYFKYSETSTLEARLDHGPWHHAPWISL